MFKVQLQVVSI